MTGTGKEWWYHWKADELKRANPSALVPTLIPVDAATGEADESKVRTEGLDGSWQDGKGRYCFFTVLSLCVSLSLSHLPYLVCTRGATSCAS